VGAAKQQRIGLGVRDDAAGGGDHRRVVRVDDTLEAGALVAAEGREPGDLDQIRDARAVILLDQAIELDERTAEMLGKARPERRLAGAAQADQRNPPRTVGRSVPLGAPLDQLGDGREIGDRKTAQQVENVGHRRAAPVGAWDELDGRHVERLGDRLQYDHRRVALPALDLRQVALGRTRIVRQLAPRRAALGAREPHQPADGSRECLLIEALGLGSRRAGI
jgi:hypothetical protein